MANKKTIALEKFRPAFEDHMKAMNVCEEHLKRDGNYSHPSLNLAWSAYLVGLTTMLTYLSLED